MNPIGAEAFNWGVQYRYYILPDGSGLVEFIDDHDGEIIETLIPKGSFIVKPLIPDGAAGCYCASGSQLVRIH